MFYLTYVDKIEHQETKKVFALFKHDYPFADPQFYVFKFDNEIDPKSLNYKSIYNNNLSQEEFDEMMDKVILENYEESSSLATNPKIKIIYEHFLVLERGEYYFALYDLQNNKPIFNECCPFSRWGSQNIWAEKGTYYKGEIKKDERSDYEIWIKNNIHKPILDYIEENK